MRNSETAATKGTPSSSLTSAAQATTPDGVAMRSSEPELAAQRCTTVSSMLAADSAARAVRDGLADGHLPDWALHIRIRREESQRLCRHEVQPDAPAED